MAQKSNFDDVDQIFAASLTKTHQAQQIYDKHLQPQQRIYHREGDKVGNLTLIGRDLVHGPISVYSNGIWIAQCPGGVQMKISTQDLRRGALKLQGCGGACDVCQPYKKRKRELGTFRTRPGSTQHAGKQFGRLHVQEWVDRMGWLCECACGEWEYVARSKELGPTGGRQSEHDTELACPACSEESLCSTWKVEYSANLQEYVFICPECGDGITFLLFI